MPNTPNMEREPALTIGEVFASKQMLRTYVASAVALIAAGFNLTVGDATVDNITTIIMFAAMVYAPIAAKREQAKLAEEQAAETRESVFAPATVKEIAREAAVTGDANVPDPPGNGKSAKKNPRS